MSDKVHGGTPKGSSSLCITCRNAHRVVGINMQSIIRCTYLSGAPVVKFPVADCASYDDKRTPALHEMKDIAWTVESRNRGPVGFGDSASTEIKIVSPADRAATNPNQAPMPTSTVTN